MSTETSILGLVLPDLADRCRLDDWNGNMEKIDEYAANVNAELLSIGGSVSDLTTGLASETAVREAADAKQLSAIKALIDGGAKNILQMTHAAGSITRYGVTCTWDTAAGTMTLNGTHVSTDSAVAFEFYSGNAVDQKQIDPGQYHLSGCPAGGSTATYRASMTSISGAVDTGNGADFTVTSPIYMAYRILISGDVTFDNMVFKPMVCAKEAWDISHEFVPYCPSLPELYAMVKALQ